MPVEAPFTYANVLEPEREAASPDTGPLRTIGVDYAACGRAQPLFFTAVLKPLNDLHHLVGAACQAHPGANRSIR